MRPGAAGCKISLCTQVPTSVCFGAPGYFATALLIAVHDFPPSSVRHAPHAEIATNIRFSFAGSSWIECADIPPAPGIHFFRVGWLFRLTTGSHVFPSSSVRNSPAGAVPAYSTPFSPFRPGSMCHTRCAREIPHCL